VYENISTCRTFSASNINLSSSNLTLDNKYNTFGTLLIRTPSLPYVNTLVNVLSNVFIKYQTNINLTSELLSAVKYFDIVSNVIVIQTNSYIVIEQYNYNFSSNTFNSILGAEVYYTLNNSNELTLITPFVLNNLIVTGKLITLNPLSSTSTPTIFPILYTFDHSTGKRNTVFSFNQSLSSQFIIKTPLTQVGTPRIVYNQNKQTYSLIFFCYNMTGSQFLLIYNFQPTLPNWTLNSTYIVASPEYITTLTS